MKQSNVEERITIKNKKITNVPFPQGQVDPAYSSFISLLSAVAWQPNEGLSIITGINGIGKSQLLKYLVKRFVNEYKAQVLNHDIVENSRELELIRAENINILYVPHNFEPKSGFGIIDLRTRFIEQLENEQGKRDFLLIYMSLSESKEKAHDSLHKIRNLFSDAFQINEFKYAIAEKVILKYGENISPSRINLEEEIINYAKTVALQEPTKLEQPNMNNVIGIFLTAFEAYQNFEKHIRSIECTPQNLIKHYFDGITDNIQINQDEVFDIFGEENKNQYVAKRMRESWGSEQLPWQEIGMQLRELFPYFKYELYYDKNNGIHFTLTNQNNDKKYYLTYEKLSSGEQMILSVLSWQYCNYGYSTTTNEDKYRRSAFKTDIILLDEPDRHFDPKLCKIFYKVIKEVLVEKLGIQIIMTTHRLDMIALSSPGEIITAYKNDDNILELSRSHKLLAMFRLTSNLREFTNHHHIVYTESRKDALFYEGVYKKLIEYSNIIRQNGQIAKWQEQGSITDSLISRRFPLSFMSVSDNGDAGGNCGKVIDYIAKDITAHKNLAKTSDSNRFYDQIELQSPYGIVDNDYGKEYKILFDKIHRAEGRNFPLNMEIERLNTPERVVILKRHSLENYVCDPFLLCSFLEIILKNLELDSNVEKNLRELHRDIDNNELSLMQQKVNNFFNILLLKSEKIFSYRLSKLDKSSLSLEKETYEGLLEKITKLKELKEMSDSIYDQPIKIMINDENIIKVMYPKEILDLQGHTIAEGLFGGKKEANRVVSAIVEEIYREGLKFIPLDLVEIIFELNNNVRIHMRDVLKPGIKKLKWSEKLSKQNGLVEKALQQDERMEAMEEVTPSSGYMVPVDEEESISGLNKKRKFGEDKNDSECYRAFTVYDNQILNHKKLLKHAYKIGEIEAVNALIKLGENDEIAQLILHSMEEFGYQNVLNLLFGEKDTESENTQDKVIGVFISNQDDQTLEAIAKIEAVIGKEALAEITGWHKYISKALSNNSLSGYAINVIQVISKLINNLEDYLDFGIAYEDININDQVAIILTRLENIFDFVASGTTYVGLPRRYSDFDPDDYYAYGGSGGGNGDNENINNQANVNNIDFSSLFVGLNVTSSEID